MSQLCSGTDRATACLQERYGREMQPRALELVARRISAATGDMRSAMEVCRTARAIAARQRCGAAAAAAAPVAEPAAAPLRTAMAAGEAVGEPCATAAGGAVGEPCVTAADRLVSVSQVAEALRVCAAGGSAQAQGHAERIRRLPMQQQLLLCTLAIARGAAQRAAAPAAVHSGAQSPLFSAPMTPRAAPRAPAATPLGRLSAMLASHHGHTQRAAGFGLSGAPSAANKLGPKDFKSFPMPDDVPGLTPASATPSSAGCTNARLKGLKALRAGAGKGGRRADCAPSMSLEEAFRKYQARGREAGVAVVESALQLGPLVDALTSAGLLEAAGRSRGRSAGSEQALVQLCVSTNDVKHALCDNHLLRPLIEQLP
jgi:hypothetical protein